MKHLSIPTLLPAILLAISLLVAGCNKELLTEDSNPEQGVQLCLNIDGMPALSAGGTTRAVNENTVKDLWILQFQMNGTSTTDGTLMSKIHIANVANASNIIYRPLPGDNMALYLVANSGITNESNFSLGSTLIGIKQISIMVTTNTGSNYPFFDSPDLTMVGQSATKKFTLGEKVTVNLIRTMAKIDLTVTNMLPMQGYPQLTLQSVQLKSVPDRATSRPIDAASGNDYPLNNGVKNYNAVTMNSNIFRSTYYLSPNIRGVNTNITHESQKNVANAPSTNATYIEIIGKAKASAHSPEVDVLYRLFPGANNTTNYNIEANTAYTVNIELTGINATDTRMRISTGNFDLMQGGVDGDHQDNINGWKRPGIGYYYYTDGTYSAKLNSEKTANGIIYYVDPDDPKWFKVMALEGQDVGEPQWSATTTYEIGVGARSLADGKGNAAAIKAYFEENKGGIVAQTTFSGAFNAHAWCYNHKGKGNDALGTWHMPARDELQYLYCAYNGIYPPKTWTSTISGSNSTNRGTWNKLLTAAGGTGITTTDNVRIYWTSTEISISAAYGIHMETSGITSSVKNNWPNHLRCVRTIAPPPAVGDYYYTDGTYSKELVSGKTPNGIVFYVDPTRFKVMALDQGEGRAWSAKTSYTVGDAALNIEDGRINVAAIRKYSKDHVSDAAEATRTTGTILTDFYPTGYCYEYQGKGNGDSKGTWYLPARNELLYLCCAYNGAALYIWDNVNKGPVNTQARNNWNALLTETGVGGTVMLDRYYWSSTEWGNGACGANFTDSEAIDNDGKQNMRITRCVREIKR